MLRTVISYGATYLEDPEAIRLKAILNGMKFSAGSPRTKVLTAEMVVAIRAKAHELGRPSIALAQALQFECTLRQKDVVGEWAPMDEPGMSAIHDRGKKWMRGLRWEEIDANLILRHVTSKKQKEIVVDLKLAPMVIAELAVPNLYTNLGQKLGPMIIDEKTGLPYRTFAQRWRPIARAAGVPDDVWQMDTRAGAISEATDVAPLEDVRHAAAHSNISMTQRYSRTGAKKTARVMSLRAALRTRKDNP